ncbi:MAG: deoxyribonuclease IV [Candidatus Pacebacteria bacterium]|nr:deoxyribonuclease IV [Candidatus Paceibacterota bacterium]
MPIKIGAHVSISGGLDKAIERAAEIGANCAQVFSGSPRMWHQKELSQYHLEKMFSKQDEMSVEPVFIHAKYLVNLASNNQELIRKSVRSLIHDLKVNQLIKGAGVIVHLGSHQGRGWEQTKAQLVKAINQIFEKTPKQSKLLIENSAGQNGKVASDLGEIRLLLDQVDQKQRLGWCFDTCHGFAAGYKLSGKGSVLTEISRLNLWQSLACIHLNDSKTAFGSGKDRHENIGQGKIPQEMLKSFLNDKRIKNLPLITEVPGFDDQGPDKKNLDRIKDLVGV